MRDTFDAVLIVSFGGPEGPDEVMPFLESVTRGHRIPRKRLEEVAQHYYRFGGVSPLNAVNRELAAALRAELLGRGLSLPVYLGNRCWHPFLVDTVRQMAAGGVRRALAFITSAFSSYAGCRQYLEAIEAARLDVGERAPVIERLRPFWNHPAFIEGFAESTLSALRRLSPSERASAHVVFTAHSLPVAMARGCAYEAQLREACALVAERVPDPPPWTLAFQSRSGPPGQPWLEPDLDRIIQELASAGTRAIVVTPIGFVADHMEVVYDLDIEARGRAQDLGLRMERAATPGAAPWFVRMIVELVCERVEGLPPRWVGRSVPPPVVCPPDCCPREAAEWREATGVEVGT